MCLRLRWLVCQTIEIINTCRKGQLAGNARLPFQRLCVRSSTWAVTVFFFVLFLLCFVAKMSSLSLLPVTCVVKYLLWQPRHTVLRTVTDWLLQQKHCWNGSKQVKWFWAHNWNPDHCIVSPTSGRHTGVLLDTKNNKHMLLHVYTKGTVNVTLQYPNKSKWWQNNSKKKTKCSRTC